MKKILLLIVITLCIFQLVVLATVIEMGYEAIDRTGAATAATTINANPANASGKITNVEIWANIELAGCEVAIFYRPDPGSFPLKFSTCDYETVNNGNGAGVVLAGSKQTFVVDLNVLQGDYIGIYFSAGKIELNADGNRWYSPPTTDWIPCTNETFTFQNLRISLYGTGATEEEGNAIMFGMNF